MTLMEFRAMRQPATLDEAAQFMTGVLGQTVAENLEWMTKYCDAERAYLYGTQLILEGPKGFQWMECGKGGPVRAMTLAEAERALWEEVR